MKSKQRVAWVVAPCSLSLLCLVAGWLDRHGRRPAAFGRDAYQRVPLGMARADAERALGGTRDDFTDWLDNRSPVEPRGSDLLNGRAASPDVRYWYGDGGAVVLEFDAAGRVADRQLLEVRVSTYRQRARRWLERVGR